MDSQRLDVASENKTVEKIENATKHFDVILKFYLFDWQMSDFLFSTTHFQFVAKSYLNETFNAANNN